MPGSSSPYTTGTQSGTYVTDTQSVNQLLMSCQRTEIILWKREGKKEIFFPTHLGTESKRVSLTNIWINLLLVLSSVQNVCRYAVNGFEYDESRFEGPPRNLPRDKVFKLFGKTFTVLHNALQRPTICPAARSSNSLVRHLQYCTMTLQRPTICPRQGL